MWMSRTWWKIWVSTTCPVCDLWMKRKTAVQVLQNLPFALTFTGSCHREQTVMAASEKDLQVPLKEPLQEAAASVRAGLSLATSE